jgi:isopentenyl-diphosphate Delta-isomerase
VSFRELKYSRSSGAQMNASKTEIRRGTHKPAGERVNPSHAVAVGRMPNSEREDMLILVDEQDHITGYERKLQCHLGAGLLHRAFSVLIFNDKKELLLQKRSAGKPLWPLYWSNSVCSHPRRGESYESAVQRRLQEELGIEVPVTFALRFRYWATFNGIGSENELCSVYIGKSNAVVSPNRMEVADIRYVHVCTLDIELALHPEQYTPWFRKEWERIRGARDGTLERLWDSECPDAGYLDGRVLKTPTGSIA